MKRIKHLAIASMVAGVSLSTATFGNPKDTAVQDVEVVDVKAVINQLIEIEPETRLVEFKDEFGVEDWGRTIGFQVRRQGASYDNPMSYGLIVSGEYEYNHYFPLALESGSEAFMNMRAHFRAYTAKGGVWGEPVFPSLPSIVQPKTDLSIGEVGGSSNLYLDLTIPKESVEDALVGDYSTTLTVLVTAE